MTANQSHAVHLGIYLQRVKQTSAECCFQNRPEENQFEYCYLSPISVSESDTFSCSLCVNCLLFNHRQVRSHEADIRKGGDQRCSKMVSEIYLTRLLSTKVPCLSETLLHVWLFSGVSFWMNRTKVTLQIDMQHSRKTTVSHRVDGIFEYEWADLSLQPFQSCSLLQRWNYLESGGNWNDCLFPI